MYSEYTMVEINYLKQTCFICENAISLSLSLLACDLNIHDFNSDRFSSFSVLLVS